MTAQEQASYAAARHRLNGLIAMTTPGSLRPMTMLARHLRRLAADIEAAIPAIEAEKMRQAHLLKLAAGVRRELSPAHK